jgi:hypothetical protein
LAYTRAQVDKQGWDHTKNTITITLKNSRCCNKDEMLKSLKDSLRNFSHWSSPENRNPIEVQEPTMREYGPELITGVSASAFPEGTSGKDYAVFKARTIKAVLGSVFSIADNDIRVKLNRKPENPENGAVLEAITLDDHPLIGARRWGISEDGNTITIWTESYDIAKSPFVSYALAKPGQPEEKLRENDQFKLWTVYLENLVSSINPDCITGEKQETVEFERVHIPHPWRKDLR